MKQNLFLRNKRMLLAASVAATALAATACAAQTPSTITVQNAETNQNQITVTGMEELQIAPDMAEISFSVHTQAGTAQECQQDNAEKLNAAIQTFKDLGMEEHSIQTDSYYMNPLYDWDSPERKIIGYEMSSSVVVSDIPIDQAGSMVTQAVSSGVNSIDSIQYFCSTYDEHYQQALKQAIESAQVKAKVMAEAGGRTLGQMTQVSEYGYYPEARSATYMDSVTSGAGMAKETEAAAMDMGMMAGTIDISAQVSITFELN